MLAARNLRLASVRYVHLYFSVRSTSIKNLPMLQPVAMKWITRPLAADYSKEAKTTVFFSSSYSFWSCNKQIKFSTSALALPKNLAEPSCNLSEDPPTKTCESSSSTIPSCPSEPSCTNTDQDTKTQASDSSSGAVTDVGVKLPSRDQIESFLFKSFVYIWDFVYYVYRLCLKMFETYVLNNATVQSYWKQFLKRMDDARKEIKPK